MTRKLLLLSVGVALLLLGILTVVHYSRQSPTPRVLQIAQAVSVAATPQRNGDPERGRQQLLSGSYVSCGIPARVFERVFTTPDAIKLAERRSEDQDLPYFSNRIQGPDNTELITSNCLSCHAAPLFGEIIVGLGNEFLDFTRQDNLVERAGLLVRGEAETRAWEKLSERMSAVANYTRAATVGVNVANNLTFALMSHVDPETLLWSDSPLIEPPDSEPLPVSVPPWWRMEKKNALFYQGQGQGDHARIMILAALLCADGIDSVKAADQYAPDISAYIASLRAPEYPLPVNRELAATGQQVFEQTCVRCHGSYEGTGSYPNLLVPLDVVGTDAALAQQAIDYQRFDEWFAASWYAQDTRIVPANGYMAPPLDGVWATGPFLHNGSVPTIDLLLNSAKRPTHWRHSVEREYNEHEVGWSWEIPGAAEIEAGAAYIYDTTRYGYGNGGHLFGDHLTDAERAAVLEYIKTL
ncbi:MAG: cytochrome c [Gammaproteobacteria bacterium]|nr:cytochrome c [Gammaproteobacteria bacterium]